MSILRDCLLFVALAWVLTFGATLLLCSPSFFRRDSLRGPRRIPPPDASAVEVAPALPTVPLWRRAVGIILGAPMLLVGVLFIIPAVFTMAFVATVHSYRYYRHLTYRALRSQHRLFAFPLSFSTGLMVFIRRIRQHHATPTPGNA